MKKYLFIISMLITLCSINTACTNQPKLNESVVKKSQNVFFELYYKTYYIQINVVTNENTNIIKSNLWSIFNKEGILYSIFTNYDEYEATRTLVYYIEDEFNKKNLNVKVTYLKILST